MPDEIQQTFVRSVIVFLKKQVDTHSLTPDAQESVEVAIQCLQAAFDVGDEEDHQQQLTQQQEAGGEGPASTTGAGAPVDLYEMFESVYIERNPELMQKAEVIKNEGNRLMKEGKYNEALLQYNRAITFDPKNAIFYCNRAAAYIRLGDNERAVTDCNLALSYNPTYSKAYGRLGIAYSNLARYEEAQEAYSKAIELEPENQDYRNNLEFARNARSQTQMNSIPQLTEGLNAMLNNPTIRQLFSSAELDIEQLQSLSQNPMITNLMSQIFGGMQAGGMPGGIGGMQAAPNDLLQLFQNFASQLANSMQQPGQGNIENTGDGNNSGGTNEPQPPPPSN